MLGLWLAGGTWIAHAKGGDREALACELAAQVFGPEQGAGIWQSLLFSSGSTGEPKVLVRGWRQALSEADAYADLLHLPAGAQAALLVNPWFGACTKQLLAGLLNGWCQTIGRANLEAIGLGGDLLYATPSQLQALGPPAPGAGGFAWISLTGEACPAALWPLLRRWARPEARLLNALGASETGVIANQVLPLDGDWQPFAAEVAQGKQVDLLDDQLVVLCQAGAIGRLRVRGQALMEGQLLLQGAGWRLCALSGGPDGMEFLSHDLARWSGKGGWNGWGAAISWSSAMGSGSMRRPCSSCWKASRACVAASCSVRVTGWWPGLKAKTPPWGGWRRYTASWSLSSPIHGCCRSGCVPWIPCR